MKWASLINFIMSSKSHPHNNIKNKEANIGVRWSKSAVVAVISTDSRVREAGATSTSIKAE